MFNVPLLLFQEKEVEDEVKMLNKDIVYKSATPLQAIKDKMPGSKK